MNTGWVRWWIVAASIAVITAGTGCNLDDELSEPRPGDSCDEEGATSGDLVCEDGLWVRDDDNDLDAGHDTGDVGPDDAGDEDVECIPESDEEFCARHDVECGEFVAHDNCGQDRVVDCHAEGFICDVGGSCDSGECVCDDSAGYQQCDDECVDIDSHPDHCGGCNTSCSDIEVCDGGECSEDCGTGLTDCDGACVDVTSDRDHCGSCGTSCSSYGADSICHESSCVACVGADDCGPDEICVNNDCQCETPSCDGVECGEVSNACTTESCGECGDGESCLNNECVECTSDDGCESWQVCNSSGTCVDCITDDDCSGTCGICQNYTCEPDSTKCAAGEVCCEASLTCEDEDGMCPI